MAIKAAESAAEQLIVRVKTRSAMKYGRHINLLWIAIVLCCASATAQSGNPAISAPPGHPGSAQGQLTVTLTVVSSVGVVMGPVGKPTVIVANPADPADNVSSLRVVQADQHPNKPLHHVTASSDQKKKK